MLDESKTADSDMMIIVMGDADINQCGGRMRRALWVGGVYVIDGVLFGIGMELSCAWCALRPSASVQRAG